MNNCWNRFIGVSAFAAGALGLLGCSDCPDGAYGGTSDAVVTTFAAGDAGVPSVIMGAVVMIRDAKASADSIGVHVQIEPSSDVNSSTWGEMVIIDLQTGESNTYTWDERFAQRHATGDLWRSCDDPPGCDRLEFEVQLRTEFTESYAVGIGGFIEDLNSCGESGVVEVELD